eukprot:GFUD01013512.1.p1 GENE.GFUD01013512.1~~GFUD01013512.1.p1  ORF type:complete len:292 (-),score=91.73 GFUD01013512.1:476-1351(-)
MMARTHHLLATLVSLIWLPPQTSSLCTGIGNSPYWVGAPNVEQVSLTSVRVSWNGLLKRDDCAAGVFISHGTGMDDFEMSAVLKVSTVNFLVQNLRPGQAYMYQVVAREENGLLGVEYKPSPKARFTTKRNNLNVGRDDPMPNVYGPRQVTSNIGEGSGYAGNSQVTDNPGDDFAAVEVYTTNKPLNAKQIEYKGMVVASKVKSMSMFSDIGQDLDKGEITGLPKLMTNMREEVLKELRRKAVKVGANAIIGIKMETNSIVEGILDMVVYGTAVSYQKPPTFDGPISFQKL